MIRLDRIKLFLLGFALIVVCYFVRQVSFIMSSGFAEGAVMNVANHNREQDHKQSTRLTFPVVHFNADGKSYVFTAESNMEFYGGEKVKVIYKEKDPKDAYIYSFTGFWLRNIIYFIVPLFLWSAFSLSYLSKGEFLTLHLWGSKEKPSSSGSPQVPNDWAENKRLNNNDTQ